VEWSLLVFPATGGNDEGDEVGCLDELLVDELLVAAMAVEDEAAAMVVVGLLQVVVTMLKTKKKKQQPWLLEMELVLDWRSTWSFMVVRPWLELKMKQKKQQPWRLAGARRTVVVHGRRSTDCGRSWPEVDGLVELVDGT